MTNTDKPTTQHFTNTAIGEPWHLENFDIVEIRFGSMAGWWVRTVEQRDLLIANAANLGPQFAVQLQGNNAIRVSVSDGEFEMLKEIAGFEQVIAENLPVFCNIALVLPQGWRDDEEAA